MLGFLKGAVDLLGGNLVGKLFGNKEQKETNVHDENMALLDSIGKEAAAQAGLHNTLFNSIVDGFNRLMRPVGYFGAVGFLVWAITYPVELAARLVGLNAMPEWLSYAVVTILLSPFVSRPFEKGLFKTKIDPSTVNAIIATQEQIRSLKASKSAPLGVNYTPPVVQDIKKGIGSVRLSEADYEAEMKNGDKPLSLNAIDEWNKRNNPNY